MRTIKVEACISSDEPHAMERSVRNARDGGADTIELCADLSCGGLTPNIDSVRIAREAFASRNGLMVMIRNGRDDFSCSKEDLSEMRNAIWEVADAGADGVVFGCLVGDQVDTDAIALLSQNAKACSLATTFHRAFDATSDQLLTIEQLVDCGIDRVLTSGSPWESGLGANSGTAVLRRLMMAARNRIEIVVGGGVTLINVEEILGALPVEDGNVSVHAYSSLLRDGITQKELVSELRRRASLHA